MTPVFGTLDGPPPTGLENLWLILSKPDNVPIVLMIALFAYFIGVALREARKHDRLIAQGRKEEIIKVMRE
jgi:hypothetical protein